jgi:hypothetical protein
MLRLRGIDDAGRFDGVVLDADAVIENARSGHIEQVVQPIERRLVHFGIN